jgi:hypothetical protein
MLDLPLTYRGGLLAGQHVPAASAYTNEQAR